jgi:formylmethanofuran dehydrogenase subunit B
VTSGDQPTAHAAGRTGETITCPFCGLLCDDLPTSSGGAVDTRGCAMAAAGFARGAAPRRNHAVGGSEADLATAVAAAGAILEAASAPLFHGLTADLHGIRALLALAERVGGVVDHESSTAHLANVAVARASGWVTATFGEVANRADFILLAGSDPARNFPRLHERLVRNATPLYRDAPPAVAYLGPLAGAPSRDVAPLQATLAEADLLPALGTLGALLRDRRTRPEAAISIAALEEIAKRLRSARYGVIAWDVAALPPAEAELAVELIAGMLRHLNIATRCVGLPLGGSGNGLGAMQATLWQTGWPLRVGFGDGAPLHDPWRYDGGRMLATGEADALVWVAALGAAAPPPTAAPVIALVADDVTLRSPAAVEIRVGIPGIDHPGEVIRADTVIALKLDASHPSDRPSVAAAVQAILAALRPAA